LRAFEFLFLPGRVSALAVAPTVTLFTVVIRPIASAASALGALTVSVEAVIVYQLFSNSAEVLEPKHQLTSTAAAGFLYLGWHYRAGFFAGSGKTLVFPEQYAANTFR
jgi:hypothetical protein